MDKCDKRKKKDSRNQNSYQLLCNPVIDENNVIYFVDEEKIYSINSDGTKKWECNLNSNNTEVNNNLSPVIGNNSIIYVLVEGGLIAINNKGNIIWQFKIDNADTYASSPIIGPDGTIYFGLSNFSNRQLYSIKTDCSGPASSMWPMYGRNAQHTFNVSD